MGLVCHYFEDIYFGCKKRLSLHAGGSIRDPDIKDKICPVLKVFGSLMDTSTEVFLSKGFLYGNVLG